MEQKQKSKLRQMKQENKNPKQMGKKGANKKELFQ